MFFSKDPASSARQPTRTRENSDSIEDGLNFNFDKVASGNRGGRPSKGVRIIPLEEVKKEKLIPRENRVSSNGFIRR